MMTRMLTLTVLGLAAALPGAAFADHDRGDDRRRDDKHEQRGSDRRDDRREDRCEERCDDGTYRVWIAGHYERREMRRVIPAVVRQEWVPDRVEEICIPAVTERIRIPAVTERVHCPAVMERVWVPEVRERVRVPGRWDSRTDSAGCTYRVWVAAHDEVRVVREGRYEDRCVREARCEDRVVQPERWETRVICPERREVRVVEKGHFCTVVVRPERTEVCIEKVWIAGHWEKRVDRPRG